MSAEAIVLSPEQEDLLVRLDFAHRCSAAFVGEPTAQHVYFFQQGEAGPVKIGASNDVARRFRELQTGSAYPLRVIGVAILGGRAMEKRLHGLFEADRLEGEWFSPSELLYEIAEDFAGAIR